MAAPKVFVSSTCFDLGEVRDQLRRFIECYGFVPVLSENGDVFYHPSLHTHEACINEISHCQLFVLIIGGRFGGKYVADKEMSITNAEYLAARELKIPVFTYVRNDVLSNHHIYLANRENKDAPVSKIDYPAIQTQSYALNIFQFIDEVRKSSSNNAIEGFDSFQNIEDHLRKQWSGMIFDLLKSREVKAQIDITNKLIEEMSNSSQKLEEIVKSFFISSKGEDAKTKIAKIEQISAVQLFFENVLTPTWSEKVDFDIDEKTLSIETISQVIPDDQEYADYLVKTGLYVRETFVINSKRKTITSSLLSTIKRKNDLYIVLNAKDRKLQQLYENVVKNSTADEREDAIYKILLNKTNDSPSQKG